VIEEFHLEKPTTIVKSKRFDPNNRPNDGFFIGHHKSPKYWFPNVKNSISTRLSEKSLMWWRNSDDK
jgi:hypothetical protein